MIPLVLLYGLAVLTMVLVYRMSYRILLLEQLLAEMFRDQSLDLPDEYRREILHLLPPKSAVWREVGR